MSWAELSAFLAIIAEHPPFIVVVAACAFFAGMLIGLFARTPAVTTRHVPAVNYSDTHAHVAWTALTVYERDQLIKHIRSNHASGSNMARPRMRAVGTPLKPSYDASKREHK